MKQLTFVIFKPDATAEVQREFFDEVKKADLTVVEIGERFVFTPELCEEHYGHIRNYGAGIYEMCAEWLLAPDSVCTPMIISGVEVIAKVRKIIGPTRQATWGLRKTSESAFKDSPKNYVHASGNEQEVQEEIARFAKYFKNLYTT